MRRIIPSRTEILQAWRTRRSNFLKITDPYVLRAKLVCIGVAAFTFYVVNALVRMFAVGCLLMWADICFAQPFDAMGETYNEEYYIYGHLLVGAAVILTLEALLCVWRGYGSFYFWTDLRERHTSRMKRSRLLL
jgi:hypothetical protein